MTAARHDLGLVEPVGGEASLASENTSEAMRIAIREERLWYLRAFEAALPELVRHSPNSVACALVTEGVSALRQELGVDPVLGTGPR